MRKRVKWLSVLLAATMVVSSVDIVSAASFEGVEEQQGIQEEQQGIQEEQVQQTEVESMEQTTESIVEQMESAIEETEQTGENETEPQSFENMTGEETCTEQVMDSYLAGSEEDSSQFLKIEGTAVVGLNEEGLNQDCLELVIPDSISEISAGAFQKCENIISVVLPCNLRKLGDNAFAECSNLKKVEIQSNMIQCGLNRTNPAYGAFRGCAIEEVIFGINVNTIPEGMFCGAGFASAKTIYIPATVSRIGAYCFANAKNATVDLPENSRLTDIENCAFKGTNVIWDEFPQNIKKIGTEAFSNCQSITDVVLPGVLTNLGEKAFYGCSNLRKVEILSNTIQCGPNSINAGYGPFKDCAISEVIFGEKVTAIPGALFHEAGFAPDTTIELPKQITKIGVSAFADASVKDVIIPEGSGLAYIEDRAFANTSVTIGNFPQTVTKIGERAFHNCSNITEVILPESLVLLKERVFENCQSLSRVEIKSNKIVCGPNSINAAYGPFKDCAIKEIVFGEKVSQIPDGLFCGAGFSPDVIVEIPSTIVRIGKANFANCSSWMSEVTLPDSITLIDNTAFDGSKNYVKYRVTSGSYAHKWVKEKGYDMITVNGISYNLNGGKKIPGEAYPASFISGEKTTKQIAKAERNGYLFDGWYTDEALTQALTAVSEDEYDIAGFNDNISLYAKWVPIKYTIKFNENKPESAKDKGIVTNFADMEVTYDQSVTLYDNKNSYTKYTFVEWNTKADGTGTKYASGETVKNLLSEEGGEITLYGIWEAGTYSIAYDSNASDIGGNVTGSMENSILTFDRDDNTVAENQYNVKGYEFLGWSTRADGKGISISESQQIGKLLETAYATDIGDTITLYAKWGKVPYTVTLYKNDGVTSEKLATINVMYGQNLADAINVAMSGESPAIEADALKRNGYRLLSWNTMANGKGKKYALTATNLCNVGEEIALYAQWSGPLAYKVTYDLAGGKNNSRNPKYYKYSLSEDRTLINPTKKGYTFTGWKVTEGEASETQGGLVTKIPHGTYGDIKLQAQWSENKYKVIFHGANEYYSDVTGDYIEKEDGYGYVSEKVDTLAAANHYIAKPELAGTVGITAWTTKPNGKGKSYSVGTMLSKLSTDNFNDGTGKGVIHLYAKWGNAKYEITYDLAGGVNHKSNPSIYEYSNRKALAIKNPTRPGYTFAGWNMNDSEERIINYKIPKATTGNVRLKANWAPINYTVKINLNNRTATAAEGFITSYHASTDGSGDGNVTSILVKDGENLMLTNPGYTLVGFNTTSNGKGINVPIESDGKVSLKNLTKATTVGRRGVTVTLYAQWRMDTYNINYVNIDPEYDGVSEEIATITGVTNSNVIQYKVNQSITLRNPSRYGFEFQGWFSDKECTQKVTRINKGTTGDITLYGKWKIK